MAIQRFELDKATDLNKEKLPIKTVNGKGPDSSGNIDVPTYTHPSTHPASMITGLATVATSGSYNDLSNKPTIASVPVASVIAFAANSAPSGYLLCNGAAVSRTTYANLFAVIGTTYGEGDGSTTFNLPNLTDRFIQGSGTAGTVKSAGLPNITGEIKLAADVPSATGSFYVSAFEQRTEEAGGGWHGDNVGFKASLSSSIYGNSDTVQPPALTMRYYIKY